MRPRQSIYKRQESVGKRGHTRAIHGNRAADESVDSFADGLEFSIVTEEDESVEVAWYPFCIDV